MDKILTHPRSDPDGPQGRLWDHLCTYLGSPWPLFSDIFTKLQTSKISEEYSAKRVSALQNANFLQSFFFFFGGVNGWIAQIQFLRHLTRKRDSNGTPLAPPGAQLEQKKMRKAANCTQTGPKSVIKKSESDRSPSGVRLRLDKPAYPGRD